MTGKRIGRLLVVALTLLAAPLVAQDRAAETQEARDYIDCFQAFFDLDYWVEIRITWITDDRVHAATSYNPSQVTRNGLPPRTAQIAINSDSWSYFSTLDRRMLILHEMLHLFHGPLVILGWQFDPRQTRDADEYLTRQTTGWPVWSNVCVREERGK